MWDDVRARAPDLYLSLLLSRPESRAPLLALYALEAEMLKIPSRVSQPALGLVRIAWWRDMLAMQSTEQPLLQELAQHWPNDAAALSDFAETFSNLFEDEAATMIRMRAILWATLVARALTVPVPQAYAAAAAHYGLLIPTTEITAKPLKLIIRLAGRRAANRNNWLGDVWTALKTSLK